MIKVDDVYKTVLLILNKEQRGYMTPDEFNKIGSQVQLEIFESYFNDIHQLLRQEQSDYDYSDRADYTDEKIAKFKKEVSISSTSFTVPTTGTTELYRLGDVELKKTNGDLVEAQKINRNEYYNINKSKLTSPSNDYPVYFFENNVIKIFPTDISITDAKAHYLVKPQNINWTYDVDATTGGYIHDATDTNLQDFELHISEQSEVIKRILLYAGVLIKDPLVLQSMNSELSKDEQLDKS